MTARAITWLGAVILALSAAATAAPPEPGQVIRRGIDDVLDVLRDPTTQPAAARAQRIARLRVVADRLFDWPEMSQRCLGPAWRTIDASQRKRFAEVFPDVLASAYLDDLDKFRGDERVTIERSLESRDQAEVHTLVVTHSGERVPMVYWLHHVESAWRVYDFSIEGVSLVNKVPFLPVDLAAAVIGLTGYRILMVWVYERTQSLLVGMAMHTGLTASMMLVQPLVSGATLTAIGVVQAIIPWLIVASVVAYRHQRTPREAPRALPPAPRVAM